MKPLTHLRKLLIVTLAASIIPVMVIIIVLWQFAPKNQANQGQQATSTMTAIATEASTTDPNVPQETTATATQQGTNNQPEASEKAFEQLLAKTPSYASSLQTQQPGNWGAWKNEKQQSCLFQDNAYISSTPPQSITTFCMSDDLKVHNFALEVQMTFITGENSSYGGLMYRFQGSFNPWNYANGYTIQIDPQGNYAFKQLQTVLKSGTVPRWNKGMGATNLLWLQAQGNTFTFFANRTLVASIENNTVLQSGSLGLSSNSNTVSASVKYSNMKIWNL